MSSTFHLVSHPDYNCLLRLAGNRDGRMKRVAYLREHAIMVLESAIARIPVAAPRVITQYKVKGVDLAWQLENDSDAGRFYFTLPDYNPTPAETEAAELLMACVAAQKAGDVPEFAEREAAQKAAFQRQTASKKVRLGRIDPLREKIREIFRRERRENNSLKTALANWNNQTIDHLRLTYEGESSYLIDDENADNQRPKLFTERQLRTLFIKGT